MGGALYSYAKYSENMVSGIQKHFHKHTIEINPVFEAMEHTKKEQNGYHEHNHRSQNSFVSDINSLRTPVILIEDDSNDSASSDDGDSGLG